MSIPTVFCSAVGFLRRRSKRIARAARWVGSAGRGQRWCGIWLLTAILSLTFPAIAGTEQDELRSLRADLPAGEALALNLVLAVDASASVTALELAFQIQAYVRAFRLPTVCKAVRAAGGIGVSLFIWSGLKQNQLIVDWKHLQSRVDCLRFAAEVAAAKRQFVGAGTSISDALRVALQLLERAPFIAERRVIDISGDGENNRGRPLAEIRTRLGDQGITVNGLAVENEVADLGQYYTRFVSMGPGHFVLRARSFTDFARALEHKLVREISGPLVARDVP